MKLSKSTGARRYDLAKKVIAGGVGLLSKRPEMYLPELWPSYYDSANGIKVVDLDGETFNDFTTCGVGTSILGYANEEVNRAVIGALEKGSMTTLNCYEEVELAEKLLELHSWAQSVKYARTGGEAAAIAIRIARAFTGKSVIALCGYHGWHDWYLALNLPSKAALDEHLLPGLEPTGVPKELFGSTVAFTYGDCDSFEHVMAKHGSDLAAVIMEPARNSDPPDGFLELIRSTTQRLGIPLIFDEITVGFREVTGGYHTRVGVTPDIALFGKTISNGIAMSAIVGVADVMKVAQESFISSAYFTERLGPVAALKTIELHAKYGVGQHVGRIGSAVQDAWAGIFQKHDLAATVSGLPGVANFSFDADHPAKLTFLIQEMLKRGYLITNQFYPTLSHQESDIKQYVDTLDFCCSLLAENVSSEGILDRKCLEGPVKHSGFMRLI